MNIDGKDYELVLDGPALREVRRKATRLQGGKEVPLDLGDPIHLCTLDDDVPALTDALVVLCKESLKRNNVSVGEFEKLIRGEVIEEGHGAVLEAARGFFHGKKKSEIDMCWKGIQEEREAMAAKAKVLSNANHALLNHLNMSEEELLAKLNLTSDSLDSAT